MNILIRSFFFFGFFLFAAAAAGMFVLVAPLGFSIEMFSLWFMTASFGAAALFLFGKGFGEI